MSTVHVEKNTYTVEPLYQWDLNQMLVVYGLSLASIPEVHFTNAAMGKALVRQATMDAAGVIRAEVPNSLLQKPYTVQAYICTYEGSTFETQYKLDIPVKARNKPEDYTLEDDLEVYSFNALENQVVNALVVAQAAAEAAAKAIPASQKGASNGVASLDDTGKVPAGQLPLLEDYGAAPAGYGLGGSGNNKVTDVNTTTAVGFYAISPDTANIPDIGGMSRSALLVERRYNDVYQTLISKNGFPQTTKLVRCSTDAGATWGEWEYVNPPMLLGVEYRTTERCEGKPVYAKRVDCGEVPSQGVKTFTHGIANIERCVRDAHEMKYPTRADSYTLPFMTGSLTINASFGVNSVTIYDSSSSHAGYRCYSTLYYTKTTD